MNARDPGSINYKEINDYYVELNKTLAQERAERERRELEDGPAEAYHEELDTRHEWRNAEAAAEPVIRELDEDEDLEDEESEDDDDFFANLDVDDD